MGYEKRILANGGKLAGVGRGVLVGGCGLAGDGGWARRGASSKKFTLIVIFYGKHLGELCTKHASLSFSSFLDTCMQKTLHLVSGDGRQNDVRRPVRRHCRRRDCRRRALSAVGRCRRQPTVQRRHVPAQCCHCTSTSRHSAPPAGQRQS